MKKKEVEVKLQILKLIKVTAEPFVHRARSLMEDHYSKRNKLSQANFVSLLELQSASETLVYMLTDIIQEAEEEKVELLYLNPLEYTILLELSKLVESTTRRALPGISMRTH